MNETPAPAKRLSLSQIVEMLLTRERDRSSVTISRSPTTGVIGWEVKVRVGDDDDVANAAQAAAKAIELASELQERYPTNGKHDDGSLTLSRNAKGETQIVVEGKTSDTRPSLDEVEALVLDVYARQRAKFPLATGYVGAVAE